MMAFVYTMIIRDKYSNDLQPGARHASDPSNLGTKGLDIHASWIIKQHVLHQHYRLNITKF